MNDTLKVTAETKWCGGCSQTKLLTDFAKASGKHDGRQSQCRDCLAEWKKQHPVEPGRYQRNYRRDNWKRLYGITPEQYDEMVVAQGGVCASCGFPPMVDEMLQVDHDHTTQAVRGLLHGQCNRILGHAHDDIRLLEAAADYIRKVAS